MALKGDDFLSREKIESYGERVEKGNEWLRKARQKIDEGVTLFRTGEITEWDDWADHPEAEMLMKHNEEIRRRAFQIGKKKKTDEGENVTPSPRKAKKAAEKRPSAKKKERAKTAEEPAGAKKPKEEEKIELTDAQEKAKDALKKLVLKEFGEKLKINIDDPRFDKALNIILHGMTPEQANRLAEGKSETLTKIGAQMILDAFAQAYGYEDLGEMDPTEVDTISGMDVTVGGKKMKFREAFGEDLAQSLSRSHEFRAGEGGRLEVKEGDAFVPVTEENMASLVPTSLRPGYESVVEGQTEPDKFQEQVSEEAKAQEAFQKLGETMRDPEKVKKALGEMNLGELLASIGQLWRLFQTALKTGDFQSLQDGLEDFQSGRNPIERIEGAKQTYEEAINGSGDKPGIQDVGDLMALYNQPYGPEATKLFGEGKEKVPYRIQMQEVIQTRIAGDLGVDITEMKKLSATSTQITCSRGADRYVINLEQKGGKTYARSEAIKLREDGSEYRETMPLPENGEVKNTKSGEKNMALVLFGIEEAPAAGEGTSEDAETAKAPEGVKPEYFEMTEGKMVLKDVKTPSINDILDPNVTEVTIRNKETGKEVTATRDGNPGFTGDNRLRIHDGDVIVSTKLKKEKTT